MTNQALSKFYIYKLDTQEFQIFIGQCMDPTKNSARASRHWAEEVKSFVTSFAIAVTRNLSARPVAWRSAQKNKKEYLAYTWRQAICKRCAGFLALQALSWYRCDLCDFELCNHCLAWRARQLSDTSASGSADSADVVEQATVMMPTMPKAPPAGALRGTGSPPLQPDDEESQRIWFNHWAASFSADRAQWELFRGGSWIPFGTGLSSLLSNSWQAGHDQVVYMASNEQKHLFNFRNMEQVNLSTGKRRQMQRVQWEVELDRGWFLVEDDLALRLRLNQIWGKSLFEHCARDMKYTIDIQNIEQVNELLGTRRKLRKIEVDKAAPKMSRHHLRRALEDDFNDFACAARQWLALRWPWQELGDCSIDADGFIRTGLAAEIATALFTLQHEMPQLGGILQNMIWFDYADSERKGTLSQSEARMVWISTPYTFPQILWNTKICKTCLDRWYTTPAFWHFRRFLIFWSQVVDAILQDSRWPWARAGALRCFASPFFAEPKKAEPFF